ncbi:MAG: four-carbon acid sugar kinase family protein [Phreatobacter sp.]|uniref:four-carbon acid sugar kinase family protein n=1 Tax=Phreatobacter sp. TaxID=1966341 RepID=UPI002734D193|nr:four-carbon acid sugar kinase family protein [Phreatobacter sp.]MDP2800535.1 four-carbon acid sugar kinase family protein [Phreatobacter sp.]
MSPLPPGPLVAFYGDDFTGSSAVMEVMAFAGLSAVMFLSPPTPARLAAFADRRCIGIAGIARSRPPDWMDEHLPPLYAALGRIGAPLVHYKVCSTFDSSPQIGSIGRAIDLGAQAFPARWIPLVVGAPALERYQVFGQLFAGLNGTAHRLDRHPVMARHPVTPMDEADLIRHLGRQTGRRMGLIDFPSIKRGDGDRKRRALAGDDAPVIAIDVLDDETLAAAGALIWQARSEGRFVAGSQGVEYALVAHWREAGLIPCDAPVPTTAPAERIAVVSGSCSPVTAGQIAHAEENGFASLRLDVTQAVDDVTWDREIGRVLEQAKSIAAAASPLIYTARGPDDPAIAALAEACRSAGADPARVNDRIGAGLGRVLEAMIADGGLTRAAIAGGDTSGHAALALGIDALEAIAPLAAGSPLCRAHATRPGRDGLELALKGGQMGTPDFFSAVRAGRRLDAA